MKKLLVFMICLLMFGLFSGCAAPKTQSMNFDSIAEEMTQMMYSGDYDGAAEYISEEALSELDAAALEQIVIGTVSVYGNFIGVTGIYESSMTEYVEYLGLGGTVDPSDYDYVIYFEGIAFDQGNMGFYFMFDPADRSVVGISVCGTEERNATHGEE